MHKLESEILLFFVKLFVPASDEPEAVAEQDKMSSRDGVAGCVGGTTDGDGRRLSRRTGRLRDEALSAPLIQWGDAG